ncbi:hypothetical protein Slin_0776 [Spirosoma linguale DSM 74]|uniref:Uncharacterized protein n=1 Tax=Spirosoma linguale (strain ATCC 33905 / DSM 74 / LMG 10896 / Claus 1) TaxID=504472 RepID=D2QH73_SPILD|nr:hypothetical protein Slin_0776 [Spirosoma linguale DSM 74]
MGVVIVGKAMVVVVVLHFVYDSTLVMDVDLLQ